MQIPLSKRSQLSTLLTSATAACCLLTSPANTLAMNGKITRTVEGAAFILTDASGADHLIKLFGLPDDTASNSSRVQIEQVLQFLTMFPDQNIDCVVRMQIKKLSYCECFPQYTKEGNSHNLGEFVTEVRKLYEIRPKNPNVRRSLTGVQSVAPITQEEAFKIQQMYGEAERLAQKAG